MLLCVSFIRFFVFKLNSLFVRSSEKIKSLYKSIGTSLDILPFKLGGTLL